MTVTGSTAPATPPDPATEHRSRRYSYDLFGSLLTVKGRETDPAGDPVTGTDGELALLTQNTYDGFERLLATRDDADQSGQADAKSEVYCYDGQDRRDRKITGVDPPSETASDEDSFQKTSQRLR